MARKARQSRGSAQEGRALTGVRLYEKASEALGEVRQLIATARTEVICIGATFDRSARHYDDEIIEATKRGVVFKYVVLSRNADLGLHARQFGQSVDLLRAEVDASDAALRALRQRSPDKIRVYSTRSCPSFRMYVADTTTPPVRGVIIFYGNSTDSPKLPAWVIDDMSAPPFDGYLQDGLRSLQLQEAASVFIIHGHSEARWRELKEMIRGFGLKPVVLQETSSGGMTTLIEKFESCAADCRFAMAIFTKDDVVENGGRKYFQARPNVIYELGWFAAKLGRSRVLLLLEEGVDILSDLQGVEQVRFARGLEECYRKISSELVRADLLSMDQ
jgi:hypothetical protein